MLTGRTRHHRHGRDDRGVALVAVMIAMFVISSFLLVSLTYGLQNSTASRRDQDAKTAAAAAQAGLEEYLSRLNASPTYYTRGNVDSTNPAFTSGRAVPGTGTSGATYTYKVLTSSADTVQYGIVRLQVTGKSGPGSGRDVSRTITANLRTKGFLSFIYLSDIEVTDPGIAGTSTTNCSKYYYANAGRKNYSGCGEIQWTGGDTVNGPLHSNDALQINGAVNYRNAQTETSCPATDPNAAVPSTALAYVCSTPKTWWGTAAAGSLSGYSPHYAAPIALPDGNDSLATYTTPGADGAQTGPGCYYTGATKITFSGTTMSVLSPSTTSNKTPSRCYNYLSPGTTQTVAIPPVIYVDETASSCSYRAAGYPATSEAVTVGANDANYWTSTGGNKTTNYRCGRGTAYISGSADAQTTVAAADDIVVTGNLSVADNLTTTDVIGLIADNNVWVYHPLTSTSTELLASSARVTVIQAAILSVSHSFVVQNWGDGDPLGTLNVTGAIAQKYRGPVGTGSSTSISTGYHKNYVYDPRLAYLQPPYFLSPTSSQWLVTSMTDD
jgi:type II secretory pathway pseudopilin PulG